MDANQQKSGDPRWDSMIDQDGNPMMKDIMMVPIHLGTIHWGDLSKWRKRKEEETNHNGD